LWRIANDPEVRLQSFGRPEIGLEEHCHWFNALLVNPSTTLLVLEIGGVVAAQVRYDHDREGLATVHFAVAPGFRRRGLGSRALEQSLAAARDAGVNHVRGFVLATNVASAHAFQRAGYVLGGEITERGAPCLVFDRALK
jgi:RimJ/RimL family protein N-acetyltransferase